MIADVGHKIIDFGGEARYRFGMPTVLRIGKFRFHFYSDEGREPPHIHVRTPDGECKFWLEPVILLAYNKGVRAHDLRDIERQVYEHQSQLKKAYNDYHSR